MDDIRVTYSGLLGFAVAVGGMIAGLAFIIIVTRQLEPEEFGIWIVISSMTSYSITAEPIISYWTTRQIARGKPVGKTAMSSTSLFAGGSIPVYVLSVYLFSSIEPTFFDSMLLGAILIPIMFIQGTLSGVNLGHKPHAVSVGRAAFQFFKIPAGLALVFFLELGLDGVILAIFVAYLFDIAVQLRYARPRLTVPRNFAYLREWIKQSWVPLYGRMPRVLNTMDIIIYTIIVGSVVGAAYYAAALVVSRMVQRSGQISQALYPKMLAKGDRDYISENFILVMYFVIPLVILAILFSRHAMFLLNPEYAGVWMAGVLLALGMFLRLIMKFLHQVLMGTDDVDMDEMPPASTLLRSRLFLVGTIENIYYAFYLVVLATFLYALRELPEPELVVVWSAVMLSTSAPFLSYYVILTRRHAPFRMPYGSMLRYGVGGICMAIVFLITNEHVVTFDVSIYLYLPGLLLEMAICCATYLGITYAIDKKTRRLFGLVVSEITTRRRS